MYDDYINYYGFPRELGFIRRKLLPSTPGGKGAPDEDVLLEVIILTLTLTLALEPEPPQPCRTGSGLHGSIGALGHHWAILAHWRIAALGHWGFGALVHWRIGTLAHWRIGALGH